MKNLARVKIPGSEMCLSYDVSDAGNGYYFLMHGNQGARRVYSVEEAIKHARRGLTMVQLMNLTSRVTGAVGVELTKGGEA